QRSRERGMVKGFSEKECRLDYVPAAGDIIVEDMVVTSGLDGIFPKGIPIGRVSAIEESESGLFMNIRIKPEVSFSSIEEVLVVLGGGARSSTPE
ncbi:MAG: rod shape-determining protein MreC, partial [Deltaproteobacteria bacterium CG17_big_fil_post_rev_8_21_14_2_50_51_6]